MLNEEKIKLMTKTSIYEKNKQKDLKIAEKYYKTDYVTYSMVKTSVSVTIAYVLALLIIVLWKSEELISMVNQVDYFELVKKLIIVYAIVLVAYMMVSFAVYAIKYDRAKRYQKIYIAKLKKIEKIDDEELSMTGIVKVGGTVNNDKYTGI